MSLGKRRKRLQGNPATRKRRFLPVSTKKSPLLFGSKIGQGTVQKKRYQLLRFPLRTLKLCGGAGGTSEKGEASMWKGKEFRVMDKGP